MSPPPPTHLLGPAWGLLGVVALLGVAIVRLTPIALAPIAGGLDAAGLALYAASLVFFTYTEGYRAFQRGFSPRVVARALHLGRAPRPLYVALAPMYCMGLIGATRRRLIASWVVVVGVAALVAVVSRLPQPYRGAIDAGVVVALAWGLAVIGYHAVRARAGHDPPAALDLPDGDDA